MIEGIELYVGVKYEPGFGHLVFCGVGGIYIEVLKDISVRLAPVFYEEALNMIEELKAYEILQGTRGQKGIDVEGFAKTIVKISTLCQYFNEIHELDINPLIANKEGIFAIDTRIFINK